MVRFNSSIKTFCLYIIWEKQDKIWANIFCIPKNMDSRTPMHTSKTRHVKRIQMVVTVRLTIRVFITFSDW